MSRCQVCSSSDAHVVECATVPASEAEWLLPDLAPRNRDETGSVRRLQGATPDVVVGRECAKIAGMTGS